MPILKADNRALLTDAKYSYLTTNYASGASSVNVLNGTNYAANDYVLIGNFGSPSAEILKVKAVSTNTLTFKDEAGADVNTTFAHAESTRVYIIPYNQVKFYWTTTATYAATSLVSTEDIQEQDFFTITEDTTNSTGYGWFVFYNQHTTEISANSNAIPYSGFGLTTVKTVIEDFFSLLNNKELKLISVRDALAWLNEGYSIIRNDINLIDTGWGASDEVELTLVSGTDEYDLEDDFSDFLYLRKSASTDTGSQIYPIRFSDIPSYLQSNSQKLRYYLRGNKIGFVPSITSAGTLYYRYKAKITTLDSYDDTIDLPDNAHYAVKDFMLYRAYEKLTNPNSSVYHNNFKEYLSRIKVVSNSRDDFPDSWGIASYANV